MILAPNLGDAFGADRGDGRARARLEALLAIAFRKQASPERMACLDDAAAYARRGDYALANVRLAMVHLAVCPETDALSSRLAMADALLASGMEPATLLKALGLGSPEVMARTYDPNQLRNPAGSGVESGRWTSASIAGQAAPRLPASVHPAAERGSDDKARMQLAAIGDMPPPPPGYDPKTWTHSLTREGKVMLRDPAGNRYIVHAEDDGHWRHWDTRGPNDEDTGSWPPNAQRRRANQKKPLYGGQVASDPSGDAKPWTPPKNQFVAPFPELEPMLPGVRVPIFEIPGIIVGVP